MNLYRFTHDIDFVLRRYHISKASLMRWNQKFGGTRKSLMDKSHRPHSQHHNAHTAEELKWMSEEYITSKLYDAGLQEKNQFITGGHLNVCRILEKFVETFD